MSPIDVIVVAKCVGAGRIPAVVSCVWKNIKRLPVLWDLVRNNITCRVPAAFTEKNLKNGRSKDPGPEDQDFHIKLNQYTTANDTPVLSHLVQHIRRILPGLETSRSFR